MEKITGIFQKKKTPKEQVREWQSRLRSEQRSLDRQIREIQREEKNVQKSIREAAKRNDMTSAKSLAREIVQSRRVVTKLYNNKAQLNSVSMHLGESFATVRAVGHLQKSTEVMKLVNGLMKVPEIQQNMMDLSKEMMKAGVIEEMVSDTMDDVLDDEETEAETEEELNKVLDEVAGEYTSQLPAAGLRPKKEKQPAAAQEQPGQAVAEGAEEDEDAELESLQARLASVKS